MAFLDLTSQITGSNQAFSVSPARYIAGSTILVLNGSVQRPSIDYTENADRVTVNTTFVPLVTDILTVNYDAGMPLPLSGHPYSTTAQVLNPALLSLVTTAQWNKTELTGDVAALIQEGDNEIDSRLAGLGVALPFSVNPPMLQDLSVLYARYACFRDLYAAGQPSGKGGNANSQKYLDAFDKKWADLKDGWAEIVDSTGAIVPKGKFQTLTAPYPCGSDQVRDNYPNFPSGPYPDPPGVDGN